MKSAPCILLLVALLAASCAVEVPPPSGPVGTLLVTEVAAEPEDGRPEWLELWNPGDQPVRLANCFLRTAGGDEPVLLDLTVEPDERVIFADQADLGAEPGALRADAVLQDMTLRHSGADEVLELFCAEDASHSVLVASVTYNWSAEGLRKGHSRQLVEGEDPERWCEAPTSSDAIYYDVETPAGDGGDPLRQVEYGSPGGPAICDQPIGDGPTLPGQVLFSEIVVDVGEGATPEWFELLASPANSGTLDLRGCELLEAPHPGGEGTVRSYLIDPEQGETAIAPGERLLFARANSSQAAVDGFLVIDGTVPVDYFYSSLTFSNSELRTLSLLCPTAAGPQVIDSFSFRWAPFDGVVDGHSLELDGSLVPTDRLDDSVNDRPSSWCPADDDQLYAQGEFTDDSGPDPVVVPFSHWGTPGQPNGACPVQDPWPGEGGVIFTEIMGNPAGPDGSEEWFELWNVGGARVDLRGCRVDNDNLDAGTVDSWSVDGALVMDAGARAVLATSTGGDFWACYDVPDAHFTGMSLNNSDHETLALVCPDGLGGDVLVDRIDYDSNFTVGISLQVPSSLATAADNDDTTLWCSLPAGDPAYTFSCLDQETGDVNYGTPGEGPNCP